MAQKIAENEFKIFRAISIHRWESLGILALLPFLSVFPAYWSMGMLGQHRTLNLACFFFTLFWFVNLYNWVHPITNNRSFIRLSDWVKKNTRLIFSLLLCSIFLSGNLKLVLTDIYSGTAKAYHHELEHRYAQLKNCSKIKASLCEVDSLKNKPISIYNFDITSNPNYWINKGEAAYFEITKIKTH